MRIEVQNNVINKEVLERNKKYEPLIFKGGQ